MSDLPPTKPAHIVYLEDDRSAFELVVALIEAEGLPYQLQHVDDVASYRNALTPTPPDLILADFNLPSIDGLTALAYKRELCPDTPFIFVSGSIGEEVAIASLHNGACDFVLKDSIARLPSAIERALKEAEEHRQRVDAEKRLRESEAHFRRIAENAPDVIIRFSLRPTFRYDYISPAVEHITGYSPEDFYNDPLLAGKITHPDDVSLIRQIIEKNIVPEGIHEIRLKARDGHEIISEQRFVAVHDDQGELVGVETIARDITQWKRERENRHQLEAQLVQAQKMESIGALAGGIAHDFNNILTGILGFNELATMTLPADHPLQEELGEVRKAGLRAKDLVAQILTFARKRDTKASPIKIMPTIEEALRLVRAATPSSIEIVQRLTPGIVCADPTQIHQIILNLCTNAVQAMQSGTGKLTITLQPHTSTGVTLMEVGQLGPGDYLRLSVSDTGHGMDDATKQRIFAPFFTTKKEGEGTGLGLALVKSITTSLGGAVHLFSRINEGTTFEVYLPACSKSEPTSACATKPLRLGRGERIAVVDDECSISTFIAVRLEQLKYQPTVFNNPLLALEAITRAPGDFDVLLTDLAMPELNGLDLIRRLRAASIGLPAIIASGGSAELDTPDAATLGVIHHLPKPFTGEDLAQALQRIFDTARP